MFEGKGCCSGDAEEMIAFVAAQEIDAAAAPAAEALQRRRDYDYRALPATVQKRTKVPQPATTLALRTY